MEQGSKNWKAEQLVPSHFLLDVKLQQQGDIKELSASAFFWNVKKLQGSLNG
jgi:hypothetical protein